MADERIRYDPTAALAVPDAGDVRLLESALLDARREVLDDIAEMRSGNIDERKQPLDAGFIDFPQQLLDEKADNEIGSLIGRMQTAAAMLRDEVDRVVTLGIGGSYMGARALFEALRDPLHNQLSREQRHGVPRISFEGHNLDNDALASLLGLLRSQCRDPQDVAHRWGIIVISKSGRTLETAVAFRLFRLAIESYYGTENAAGYVVPITGESDDSRLLQLANVKGYPSVFPVPDGIGGRFSVLTPVGLFPAAVMGLDIVKLLEGAAEMTRRFREEPFGDNPALDYTAVCRLFETQHGMTIRVLSTWGSRLEALGLWYDQLLSESLGKGELGATPITGVNTRDLHSRGQQHQQGRRDKLITNVIVEQSTKEPLALPRCDDDDDGLNEYADKSVPDLLRAAFSGTNKAYADDGRPTADVRVPALNEYTLGQLFQFFMLATALEGRLIGINPYGQPGVEAYKRNMKAELARQ
ncbi:MAG: glucose-6-phosphate isomerase [Planctomycetaceae bacterium]